MNQNTNQANTSLNDWYNSVINAGQAKELSVRDSTKPALASHYKQLLTVQKSAAPKNSFEEILGLIFD